MRGACKVSLFIDMWAVSYKFGGFWGLLVIFCVVLVTVNLKWSFQSVRMHGSYLSCCCSVFEQYLWEINALAKLCSVVIFFILTIPVIFFNGKFLCLNPKFECHCICSFLKSITYNLIHTYHAELVVWVYGESNLEKDCEGSELCSSYGKFVFSE